MRARTTAWWPRSAIFRTLLRQAIDTWELKRHERFLFEYVLLAGVNDTVEDADRLVEWLGDLRHRHNVNLIPMNEHVHAAFREPAEERIQAFARRLHEHGCFITVRRSRGRDVQAACGQLVRRAELAAVGQAAQP